MAFVRLLLGVTCVGLLNSSASGAENLAILFTADTLGQATPHEDCCGAEPLGGLSRRATLIKQSRQTRERPLLLDAGNALFGADSAASQGEVIARAYQRLQYDAINICYRDFRRGKDGTLALLRSASLPSVSANLLHAESKQLLFAPYVVCESGDSQVAVIGVTQSPAGLKILPHLKKQFAEIEIQSPAEALKQWLPKARQEAEIVVLLYYGTATELTKIRQEFGDRIDVILAGGIDQDISSSEERPVIANGAARGESVTKVVLKGDDATMRSVVVDDSLPPDQPMISLLSEYLPEDRLLAAPLVAAAGEPATNLPGSYVRSTPGTSAIAIRWPAYMGEIDQACPETFKGGESLWKTSAGGRFENLLRKLELPGEGEYRISGYSDAAAYKGYDDLPPGYWVYSAPHWYIWGEDQYSLKPYSWLAYDAAADKSFSGNGWNPLSLPPGDYQIKVTAWYGKEFVLADRVTVTADHTVMVPLRTGVRIHNPENYSLESFRIDDLQGNRLGIYPGSNMAYLPAGTYRLLIYPPQAVDNIAWGNVQVTDGGVTLVTVESGVKRQVSLEKNKLVLWIFSDQRNGTEVARAANFDRLLLPPGKYDVAVNGSQPILWTKIDVVPSKDPQIHLDSGIDLELPEKPPYYFGRCTVFDAATRQEVMHFSNWGYAPLPPGKYFAVGNFDERDGPETNFEVAPGKITKLDLKTLGFSRVEFETPKAKNVFIGSWITGMRFSIVQGETSIEIAGDDIERLEPTYVEWLPTEGPVIFRASMDRYGFGEMMAFETAGRLDPGITMTVPFDADDLAERYGWSLFDIDWGTTDRETLDESAIIMMDAPGKFLTGYMKNPPADTKFLVEPGTIVRLHRRADPVLADDLPTGRRVTINFDQRRARLRPASQQIFVDCVIESPEDGEVVRGSTVKVVGQATTDRHAGPTRIAIAIDASGSVVGTNGADLDGDGVRESVIKTEVAAAKLLLEKLHEIERGGPGTAFEVTVLRFYDGADVMAPLMSLSSKQAMTQLNDALDRIEKDGSMGSTIFSAGLGAALTEFRTSEKSAPAVILFFTDGIGSSGHDESARGGLTGVTLHTIGLGSSFASPVEEEIVYPTDDSRSAVGQLQLIAAVGAPGGQVWPVPNPDDILAVIPRLPVTEIPKAAIGKVQVVNLTTGQQAQNVRLDASGFFEADLPVSLAPNGDYESNRIKVTAIAKDGQSQDSDEVTVRSEIPWAELSIIRTAADDSAPPVVEFVLDSSGSMQTSLDGTPKNQLARNVMLGLLRDTPDTAHIGLRLFGHLGFRNGRRIIHHSALRDPRLNTDSELVVPIRPIAGDGREMIRAAVDAAEPLGKTPLVFSLLQARHDFPRDSVGPKLVILVSDGKENCGGDITDVSKVYRESDVDCAIHVIGFDISDSIARHKLRRIAQFGGGRYYDADDAKELSTVLKAAVRNPGFVVLDAGGDEIVDRGSVNGSPVKLKAGHYLIRLAGDEQTSARIELSDNEKLQLLLSESGSFERDSVASP